MTNAGSILLILTCLGIGYVLEPILFSVLQPKQKTEEPSSATQNAQNNPNSDTPNTPDTTPSTTSDKKTQNIQQEDQSQPKTSKVVDFSQVIPSDFPPKVTLKTPFTFTDTNNGYHFPLKAGSKVKPLRLENNQLVIQPIGYPVEGKIDIDQTDFEQLVMPVMLKRLQAEKAKKQAPDETSNSKNTTTKTSKTPPKETPDHPITQTTKTTTEKSTTSTTPEKTKNDLSPNEVIAIMKASVRAKDVTEFDATQVVSWKPGTPLEYDGVTYQTGQVIFKASTIIGVQENDAIALIQGNKVIKWLWASTKLEMK